MNTSNATLTISPRVGYLLTSLTETPDLDTALRKVLADYVEMKLVQLRQQIRSFETKWGMSFSEFAERCESNALGRDPYDYEVEKDFWEWEQALTLLRHYESLQKQWT